MNILMVYCDPAKHGIETYNKVLKSMAQVRRERPMVLSQPKDEQQKKQRDSDIIVVLSTTKDLRQVQFYDSEPFAIFFRPFDQMINLLDEYLPRLEKLEGVSVEGFLERVFYPDKFFKPRRGMTEGQVKELEHQRSQIFS